MKLKSFTLVMGMLVELLNPSLAGKIATSVANELNNVNTPVCGQRRGYFPFDLATRIVGGVEAYPGEFPWQVSLQVLRKKPVEHDIEKNPSSSYHICGASVISSDYILTAAHCVKDFSKGKLVVIAGDHNILQFEGPEQASRILNVKIHEDYNPQSFEADIALLELANPLFLDGKRVAPICLPSASKSAKTMAVASGWGTLEQYGSLPNVLYQVALPIMPTESCQAMYNTVDYGAGEFIREGMLCAGYKDGGRDSCQGDSGGPLACKQSDGTYTLCGIVSWGFGCAQPNLPGVYTDVIYYMDWIQANSL